MLKKAQISLFIIIGVLLVIVGSFLFFNNSFELFYSPTTQYENQIKEIVESCSLQSISSGVFYLESQGGRIEQERFQDPRALQGNAFSIQSWDSEDGDIPTIDSMNKELSVYVKDNSRGCIISGLNSLTEAMNLNYDFDKNFKAEISIHDSQVVSQINFPLDFSVINSEIESSLQTYSIEYETTLGDLYSLALEIYKVEDSKLVFENLVLDQILSANDYSDTKHSLPSQGFSFSCTPRIWTKEEMKKTLSQLNNNNFKYLQFKGTKSKDDLFETNLKDFPDLQDYFKNQYVFNLDETKSTYNQYDVNVVMPSTQVTGASSYLQRYPFKTFEVTPSSGQIVKATTMKTPGKFKFGCIQVFAQSYTLDYDLVVMLNDESTDERFDFFNFPLRVHIDKNQPKKNTNTLIVPSRNEITATNDKFCSDEFREYPIEVKVEDYETGDFLDDVNISFECITLSCNLGATQKKVFTNDQLNYEYGVPLLESSVSYCSNGKFKATKNGYFQIPSTSDEKFPGTRDLNFISSSDPYLGTLYMVPLKTFTFDSNSFDGYAIENCVHTDNAEVYVTIENKAIGFSDEVFYSNTEELPVDYSQINLPLKSDIAYNVSAYYMINEKLYGFYSIESWKPDVFAGNSLYLNIPISNSNLEDAEENKITSYFDTTQEITGEYGSCAGAMPQPYGIQLL